MVKNCFIIGGRHVRNLVIVLLMGWAPIAAAEDHADNPYERYTAEVIRIIDGDTLEVRVELWPGLTASYSVRVRGIDAPERRGADCEEERAWGEEARQRAERLYDPESLVRLQNVEYDVYSGRVVADVLRWRSDRWLSFADEMIERGMAVEWYPDQDNILWCDLAQATI
ncbi:thermonuclease family protein [Jannaschia sp. CCS1]|uniref:thermonuclease family protein n=1 Tax=Jannaschia sp. (strain CCS1) TaxID=290400 RepID=UPI000053B435|nr:thermonuclease family protein [Jannaschia sp. CCS1]ABD53497.1 nuclease (SNase-like) [Jannaschia sp. CCS1]